MAKVKNNTLTEGLSGKIGGRLVFRQMRDGSTVVCAAPDFSNRVFSDGQLAHQSRFQQAAAYARVAAKTHPIYAKLAQRTMKPAYNITLSDWFHPPVIHAIKRQAGCIRVEAADNVLVDKVFVMILDEEGKTLEKGQAVQVNDAWEYVSATEGKAIAEAWDLAGNAVKQEI